MLGTDRTVVKRVLETKAYAALLLVAPVVQRINKVKASRRQMSEVDPAAVNEALGKVIDPELGRSITDLKLIDKLTVGAGTVEVEFHLTAPFCPPVFALKIASDIKAGLLGVPGVSDARVTLRGHYLADAVNKQVNRPPHPAQ